MAERRLNEIIKGAVDIHMHTSPDIYKRGLTDIEAATEAKEAGMRAIIIKNHHASSVPRADIASEVTGFPVFGGLALNYPSGGLNPDAVHAALRMGAVEIWMPTIHAAQFMSNPSLAFLVDKPKTGREGITLLDPDGALLPEVKMILEMVAEYDVILGTGHVSAREAKALVDEALKAGVKKILVNHPEADFLDFTREDMVEMAGKGAMMEFLMFFETGLAAKRLSPSDHAALIRAVGVERSIVSTDGGQPANPRPVQMLKDFVRGLMENGITESEIRMMTCGNPSRLLGI